MFYNQPQVSYWIQYSYWQLWSRIILSTDGELVKLEKDEKVSIVREDDLGASLEDEEAAAVQEQVRQIKAQEEEFETFNLKIVHRKNRHVLNISCLLFSFICKVVEEIST